MDSYRGEKLAVQKILVPDEDAEIDPVPTSVGELITKTIPSSASRRCAVRPKGRDPSRVGLAVRH